MSWCFAQQCFLIMSKRLYLTVLDIIYVIAAFSISVHDLQCLKLLM